MPTAVEYLYQWANGEPLKTHILNQIATGQDIDPKQMAQQVLKLMSSPSPLNQILDSDISQSNGH
jgi:hypothetical protein